MAGFDFKTPEQIADQYLTHLKGLKPSVNINQQDSDWWIRSRAVGGVMSGVYADQRLISNDAFPQRARHDALGRFLETYFNGTFNPAQKAEGNVLVYASATGATVPIGMQVVYDPNGNTYEAVSGVSFGAATAALIPVRSVNTGQAQNLLDGAELSIPTLPANILSPAVASGNIADGKNAETDAEAAARILDRIRTPIAGGTESDYKQWAKEASPSVVQANVLRFPFGFGTVAVIFTAGTTDIDTALDNDQPIVVVPSDSLVDTVSGYINGKRPLTDCVTIIKPTEVPVDVTVYVAYAQGNNDTVLAGQTLTQAQLVEREVKRAIYKTAPGGRKIGATGWLVNSDIQEVIDAGLSAEPNTVGKFPILLDRFVAALSTESINKALRGDHIAVPGTISVIESYTGDVMSPIGVFTLPINNNQAVAATLTGLLFSGSQYRMVVIDYNLRRRTDSSERLAGGRITAVYNTLTETWSLLPVEEGYADTESGVTFSITTDGQIQYTSDSLAGSNYSGSMMANLVEVFRA